MRHTPTPWKINCTGVHHNNPKLADLEIVYGEDEECVVDFVYKLEDAHHIVKCVNMHDELVEALTFMVEDYITKDENWRDDEKRSEVEALLKRAKESS